MRSCLNRLVAMLFSVAFLWLDVRDSWRPLARCRISELLARRERRGGGRAPLQPAHIPRRAFPPPPAGCALSGQPPAVSSPPRLCPVILFGWDGLPSRHGVAQPRGD